MTEIEPAAVEPTPAPEVFIDGLQSYMLLNGVVKLTLFSMAHDMTTGANERRIVLRMSAPLAAVAGIHHVLGEMLEKVDRMTHAGADVRRDQ